MAVHKGCRRLTGAVGGARFRRSVLLFSLIAGGWVLWAASGELSPSAEVAPPDRVLLDLDRIEGDWAVLMAEGGEAFLFPRDLLPGEASEGDVLAFRITREQGERERLNAEVRALLKRLREDDTGGDLAP